MSIKEYIRFIAFIFTALMAVAVGKMKGNSARVITFLFKQ